MKYVIPGNPIAWARTRVTRNKFWDSQKQLKVNLGIYIASQQTEPLYETGPLHIDFIFYMPIPTSMSEKKQQALIGKYHSKKPDLDNMEKFYLDAFKNVLYSDDALVAQVTKKKVYDLNPRVEFTIRLLL